jgi:hypothetical protein
VAGRPPVKIIPGTKLGFITVIQAVNTKPNSPGGQKYRIQCVCGKRETVPRFYLFRRKNPKRHCGCKNEKADAPYTKRSWHMMHVRCYNPKHVAYKDYGGRGIEVSWDWHRDNPQGWENFKRDMGERPFGLSLDRIDPNSNYGPPVDGRPRCRWATAKTQRNNQRHNTTYKAPEPLTPDDEEDEG